MRVTIWDDYTKSLSFKTPKIIFRINEPNEEYITILVYATLLI